MQDYWNRRTYLTGMIWLEPDLSMHQQWYVTLMIEGTALFKRYDQDRWEDWRARSNTPTYVADEILPPEYIACIVRKMQLCIIFAKNTVHYFNSTLTTKWNAAILTMYEKLGNARHLGNNTTTCDVNCSRISPASSDLIGGMNHSVYHDMLQRKRERVASIHDEFNGYIDGSGTRYYWLLNRCWATNIQAYRRNQPWQDLVKPCTS